MQISARSYLTAGVAFVGAGAIALTPVQPPTPTVELRAAVTQTADVALMASPNPIEAWIDVLQASATNLGDIGHSVLAQPAPVLGAVIQNQLETARNFIDTTEQAATDLVYWLGEVPAALREGLALISQGEIVAGYETIMGPIYLAGAQLIIPLQPLLAGITQTAQNFANAVAAVANPTTVLAGIIAAAGPIMSAVNAVVTQAQYVADGVQAGNLIDVANALVNVPAAIVGGILNGHGTLMGLPSPGLLTPIPDPSFPLGGIIAYAQALRENIAVAIRPPAPEMAAVQVTNLVAEVEDTATDGLAGTALKVTLTEEGPTEGTTGENESISLEQDASIEDEALTEDTETVPVDGVKSVAEKRAALKKSVAEERAALKKSPREDSENTSGSAGSRKASKTGGSPSVRAGKGSTSADSSDRDDSAGGDSSD